MKVTEVLVAVSECIKYDGSTHRVELFAVKLEDGRYVKSDLQVGCLEDDKFVWSDVEEVDDELVEFLGKTSKELDTVGWVYTSNPEVYGYPEETFELCGQIVQCEDVNAYCHYDCGDDPGPFVLELTGPERVPTGFAELGSTCDESFITLEECETNFDKLAVTLYTDRCGSNFFFLRLNGKTFVLPIRTD